MYASYPVKRYQRWKVYPLSFIIIKMSSDEYLVKYNVNSKDLKKSAIEVVHSPRNAPALPVKQYSSKKAVKEDVLDTMERKPTPKKAEPISTI